MVVWLKVGITISHHKGGTWGAQAVRLTTPPHILIHFHTAMVRAPWLPCQNTQTLPYLELSIIIIQFEDKIDEKSQ